MRQLGCLCLCRCYCYWLIDRLTRTREKILAQDCLLFIWLAYESIVCVVFVCFDMCMFLYVYDSLNIVFFINELNFCAITI